MHGRNPVPQNKMFRIGFMLGTVGVPRLFIHVTRSKIYFYGKLLLFKR